MTICNIANGNHVVSTNINGNLTNKISRKDQICDSWRARAQEQTKEKLSSKQIGNNRPNATAWKDDTPEQIKKVIILGDSIVKHVRGYDISHSLENCTRKEFSWCQG